MSTFIKLSAAKWENCHDVYPTFWNLLRVANETPQHHLREVRAEAVEWAMNKLKAEYEAYPLLHYSTFAISQHIEAQSKQYAEQVLQGDIK